MELSAEPGLATPWSQMLQREPPAQPVGNCNSSDGVSVAVLDANAIVHGTNMSGIGDRFVTVHEALEEVKDPVSRQRISLLPFTIETMEPSTDALKKVAEFARETGDLQTLSDVDIKLIALTYTLESQIHGTDHLKRAPPPIKSVNFKSLPESEMPGWGSNVPNIEEWEALEQAEDQAANESRILPLKDLNLNATPVDEDSGISEQIEEAVPPKITTMSTQIKEKKMSNKVLVSGIDASNGEDLGNEEDWQPAVGRGYHRRNSRKKADLPDLSHTTEQITTISEPDLSSGFENMSLEENVMDSSLEPTCGSKSSVACVTADFAMQNVILQMGLRLLAPNGMQIRQLHRWVLRCHACNKITSEIGRLFCPKCGNGGTMRKVSITVGENELVVASRRPRVNLRGTKFSIPMPQGGRDGISKNLVLREDQIPREYLYPKGMMKKKNGKKQEDLFCAEDVFSHGPDRRAPVKPPVGKAVLVFTGKINPNDSRHSRRR
ncbi:RNA-binding NOB1-like protein [Wolffia australiana]